MGPNPWDVGSARLLESLGFEALATTSSGFAWSLGKLDITVTRDELVAHVRALTVAISVPLNVDNERCYPGDVAETVRLLAEAAAGCSIEDYDPGTRRRWARCRTRRRGGGSRPRARRPARTHRPPAENHPHGVDDLDDTIARRRSPRSAHRLSRSLRIDS